MKTAADLMAEGVNYCGLVNMSHKGFCLATLEKLIKYWPGGSYNFVKINPRFHCAIPLVYIGYKCNSRKILGFITTEGGVITEPGDPYLSCLPVCPVVNPHLLGRYFNACNTIDNHNRMWQSDIAVEKYWATQSGYFRLSTTVTLDMNIADRKILFCHGIPEEIVEKKVSTRERNNSTVYECFNNTFTAGFSSPALNPPTITIGNRPHPHKRARYTPYLLPAAIYVASENTVSNFTTPSDFPDLLPSDNPKHIHAINKYEPYLGRVK